MADDLFYHPAVLRVIRAILLSKGIRAEQDLEDAIGDVVVDCIEYVRRTGRSPEQVSEAIAIARPIAHGRGVDKARKRSRRGRIDLGPTGDADEHAREQERSLDPVDKGRMLLAIRGVLSDDQIEALSDVGAGVPQTELAAESNVSEAAMRKRTQKTRGKALRALGSNRYWLAGGFATLLGAIAIVAGPWRKPDVVESQSPTIGELAAEQRRLAADACSEQDWQRCEKALDLAAELDERGDRAPEVSALRAAIAAGRREAGAGAPSSTR